MVSGGREARTTPWSDRNGGLKTSNYFYRRNMLLVREDEKNGTDASETEGAKFWGAQWEFINDFSTTSCASGLLHKVLRLDI